MYLKISIAQHSTIRLLQNPGQSVVTFVSKLEGEVFNVALMYQGNVLFRNVCHGSDSVESAEKEIKLWFKPEEIVEWTSCQNGFVYE